VLPDDADYERAFDRFEAIMSLWAAEGRGKVLGGLFMFRRDTCEDGSVLTEIIKEAEAEGKEWGLFKGGFFQGNPERWENAKKVVWEVAKSR
jgi:hypothetical protein